MREILNRMVRRVRSQAGFSLIEILVGGFVLVVGLLLMSQFFASAAGRILESDVRSVLHQVATQDIESIRGLLYDDVGTTDGHPQGVLAPVEDRTIQNLQVHIVRKVVYWTDSAYTGPYPANYRRVTVSVEAVAHDGLDPVEITTNVAGGVPGGTLDITVVDLAGNPVPDAQITVTNTHLVPNVNLHPAAFQTDVNGKMVIPGLDPDEEEGYTVSASKTGYNTDIDGPKIVVDGLPYTPYTLVIDRFATMNVRVIDTNGSPVTGLEMSITGPDSFEEAFQSASAGTTFTDIRYSTSDDPYIVRLEADQGYEAQQQLIELAPGSAQDVVFTVPAGGPTTTTTVPATTSTTAVVTTTTSTTLVRTSSLTIRVLRSGYGSAVSNARVSLSPGGQVRSTNNSGYVTFTGLSNQTYSMVVTRNQYYDYRGDIAVNGASTAVVYLTRR